MTYPDFIGIGAQKAGTTWLARNLQAHPEIHMPRKEVHYFDRKLWDGSNAVTRLFGKTRNDEQWRRQVKRLPGQVMKNPSFEELLWNYRYYMKPYDDLWYARVFEPKKGKVSGEITPAYSAIDREKIAHAHDLMPEAKILLFMCNPIERAWSHAVMSFDKVEKGSAESVAESEMSWKLGRRSTRKLSDYLRTLENWGAYYPEGQIFVSFLEDVRFFPERLLREIYSFLGVDPSFEPPRAEERVHARSGGMMPTKAAVSLAHSYREEAVRLRGRFGGYASFWLYCAELLIEAPPGDATIPYPLWESAAWESWIGEPGGDAKRPRFQSGPLSTVPGT